LLGVDPKETNNEMKPSGSQAIHKSIVGPGSVHLMSPSPVKITIQAEVPDDPGPKGSVKHL
jgi:hypothetical protein